MFLRVISTGSKAGNCYALVINNLKKEGTKR